MKRITVHKRSVKAKQIPSLLLADEMRENLQKKHPNSLIEIERTAGGGMSSYRLVIVTPVDVDLPEPPDLEELPYPDFKPHRMGSHRTVFGSYGEFAGDSAGWHHVQEENGRVHGENMRKFAELEATVVRPQL